MPYNYIKFSINQLNIEQTGKLSSVFIECNIIAKNSYSFLLKCIKFHTLGACTEFIIILLLVFTF